MKLPDVIRAPTQMRTFTTDSLRELVRETAVLDQLYRMLINEAESPDGLNMSGPLWLTLREDFEERRKLIRRVNQLAQEQLDVRRKQGDKMVQTRWGRKGVLA